MTIRSLALLAALLLGVPARATTPSLFTYSGFLQDSTGNPVSGVHDFTFAFFNAPTGGSKLGNVDVTVSSVAVAADGYFSVVVDVSTLPAGSFNSQTYMSVKLDAESPMSPRIQLTSVPGALSVPFGGITNWPGTQCATGQVATGLDVNGLPVCVASSTGTVTSVATGAGLTGGPITATGTISIAAGGVTSAMLAAGAVTASAIGAGAISTPALVDGAVTFAKWSQNGCSTGQIPKWNGTAWACAADLDTNSGGTVTSIAAGTGLSGGTITGTGTIGIADGGVTAQQLATGAVTSGKLAASSVGTSALQDGAVTFAKWAQNGCGTNQLARWNGAAWVCSSETSYSAAAPLSLSSGVISLGAATQFAPGYLTTTDWTAFSAKQARLSGTCPAGTYMQSVDVNGLVSCGTDANSGGTVSYVGAGSGLTGGPITGIGTLGIATGGVTSSMLAAGAVGTAALAGGAVGTTALADGSVTFAKMASNACAAGQVPKWSGTAWTCGTDANSGGTVTSVATGSGLTGGPITGSGTISIATGGVTSAMIADGTIAFADIGQNGCAANQIPKWNGSAWSCAADSGRVVASTFAQGSATAPSSATGFGTAAYVFVGKTVQVSVMAGQYVVANAVGSFGSTVAGGGTTGIHFSVCYQVGTGAIGEGVPGQYMSFAVAQNTMIAVAQQTGFVASTSGTYTVGLCGQELSAGARTAWNVVDWSTVSVVVTN